jgi:hypothetical protein
MRYEREQRSHASSLSRPFRTSAWGAIAFALPIATQPGRGSPSGGGGALAGAWTFD